MKKKWSEPEISVLSVKRTEQWLNGHNTDGYTMAQTVIGPHGSISISSSGFSDGTGGRAEDEWNQKYKDAYNTVFGIKP